MLVADLVLDFFAVHFGESEVTQDGPELDSGNWIIASSIKLEGILDFVLHVLRQFAINVLSLSLDIGDVFLLVFHC